MRRMFATAAVRAALASAAVALAAPAGAALPTPDKDDGAIKLPPGFRALVVADDLGPLRFMTVAPNGDVFVKMRTVGIIALRDTDGDGRAETRAAFGAGGGTGIALQGGYLYHSTNERGVPLSAGHRRAGAEGRARARRVGPAQRASARVEVVRFRRGRPALRRGGLALELLRQPRPREGRQGHGPDRVPQDARRLLALRPEQARAEAGRRLPLLDRPPPHPRARAQPGLEGSSSS